MTDEPGGSDQCLSPATQRYVPMPEPRNPEVRPTMATDELPDGTRDTDALSQAQRLTKLQAIVDDRVRMTFGTVKAMHEHPTFFKPLPEEKRRGC